MLVQRAVPSHTNEPDTITAAARNVSDQLSSSSKRFYEQMSATASSAPITVTICGMLDQCGSKMLYAFIVFLIFLAGNRSLAANMLTPLSSDAKVARAPLINYIRADTNYDSKLTRDEIRLFDLKYGAGSTPADDECFETRRTAAATSPTARPTPNAVVARRHPRA